MKSLRDHIAEVDQWIDQPSPGDEFDIELAPDHLMETWVLEVTEDALIIAGDDRVEALLEQYGHTLEHIGRYGAVGTSTGMGHNILEKDQDGMQEHGGGIGPKQHWQDLMQEEPVQEGAFKEIDIQLQDYERMTPEQFQSAYGMKKGEWALKHPELFADKGRQIDFTGMSGFDFVKETARILELAGVADHKFNAEDDVYSEDQDAAVVAQKDIEHDITEPMPGVHEESELDCYEDDMEEAKYQGREVQLNKPMAGDVKKSKVYVKDPKTGNVKKVNFGDKTMRIKKSNPARRRSFRARHHCDNPGPKTSARYWSCRAW